jgi:hypothetical protein
MLLLSRFVDVWSKETYWEMSSDVYKTDFGGTVQPVSSL